MREFTEDFEALARHLRIPPGYRYPSQLIKEWAKRVTNLKANGYHDVLAEYDNDLSVRGYIERILTSHELIGYEEFHAFKMQVQELDEVLKELFIPNVQRPGKLDWWEAGILRNGGGDYAEEIKEFYGISIQKPED
jgi:hypothetical protein